jgi:hypothetical protein
MYLSLPRMDVRIPVYFIKKDLATQLQQQISKPVSRSTILLSEEL